MGCVMCVCLPPEAPVDTPVGHVHVEALAPGDLVYSVHDGRVQAVPIARVSRVPVTGHRRSNSLANQLGA